MSISNRTVLVGIVAAVLASPTLAAPDAAMTERGGEGYFSIGWTRIDVDPLNDALAVLGYERFSADALSLGGEGHSRIGRLVLGGQGHGLLGPARDANLTVGPFRTRLRQGYGLVDLGYIAVQHGKYELTPMIGIGGGASVVSVVDRSGGTFGGVAADPRRSARLTRAAFLIDLGATATRFFPIRASAGGTGGLVLGVRAGWVVSAAEGEWRQEDVELGDGPDSGLAGPYVRVLFGGRGTR